MISLIGLQAGPVSNATGTAFDASTLTIFVGPNHSGKSKVLREVGIYCSVGKKDLGMVVLDRLEFRKLSEIEAEEAIQKIRLSPNESEVVEPGNIIIGTRSARMHVNRERI